MVKTLVLSAAERQKLKQLLKKREEYAGCVKFRQDVGVHEFQIGKMSFRSTFHTHPTNCNQGGFAPPSRQDMTILLKRARAGHYVVAQNGIYYVKVDCRVTKRKLVELIKKMDAMQKDALSCRQYNTKWLSLVNTIEPKCLRVSFWSWRELSRPTK